MLVEMQLGEALQEVDFLAMLFGRNNFSTRKVLIVGYGSCNFVVGKVFVAMCLECTLMPYMFEQF